MNYNRNILADSSDESKKRSSSPDGISSLELKNMGSSDYRRIDSEEAAALQGHQKSNAAKMDKKDRGKSSPTKMSNFPKFARNDSLEEMNNPVNDNLNNSYCEPIDRSNAREIDLINEQ